VLPLEPGAVVTLLTSGAGGYGDPYTRDPEAVLRDVERGVVSREAAAHAYGVVLAERDGVLAVDDPATAHARREHRQDQATADGGPERRAWESVFDTATVDRLVAALFRLPRPARTPRRTALYTAVLAGLPAGFPRTPPTPEQRDAARRTLVQEITELERMSA
jgi:N-methylhydantoinase B